MSKQTVNFNEVLYIHPSIRFVEHIKHQLNSQSNYYLEHVQSHRLTLPVMFLNGLTLPPAGFNKKLHLVGTIPSCCTRVLCLYICQSTEIMHTYLNDSVTKITLIDIQVSGHAQV